MRQMTLAHQAEFQRYTKKTRREQFLAEMDAVIPWAELLALVEPQLFERRDRSQACGPCNHGQTRSAIFCMT